jgi:hypothetical protein
MGYERSAAQSHSACFAPKIANKGRVGPADPVVQAVVVQSEAEAGSYAATFALSTPVSNTLLETHMRCMITASLTCNRHMGTFSSAAACDSHTPGAEL